MKITITTYGTLGDTLPFIELALRLRRQGHEITMAVCPSMVLLCEHAGLAAIPNGRLDLGREQAVRHASSWNRWDNETLPDVDAVVPHYRMELENGLPALLEAAREADLLVTSPQQQLIAAMVAEAIEIPWLLASVTPSLHAKPGNQQQPNLRSELIDDALMASVNMLRKTVLDGSFTPIERLSSYLQPKHFLLACSAAFYQLDHFPCAHARQVGSWFYAGDAAGWQPSPQLEAFMLQQPSPLVLSMSSQPLEDSQTVLISHARAAMELGIPMLIQSGWAGFAPAMLGDLYDPANFHFAGFMPQDWLFAHAAALIHHGGAGTTARALRNGCPMLVEPYGNDQFFNALQVVRRGVGAAMDPTKATVESLSQILSQKVLTETCKINARKAAESMGQEDGLSDGVTFIEDALALTRPTEAHE
jgi:UDP:flavonoid glycosyltransferase YjiC (YdhE family)